MPDRSAAKDLPIKAENILAVQAIYFAYMLEEMRVFQVVERLAQLFSHGLLPIGKRKTGSALLAMAFGAERLTGQDRQSLYARALGATAGEAGDATPNRDFLSLWLRFVVAVTAYAEQHGADHVLAPPSAANADVRRAARALAANASDHGGGLTQTMAAKLLTEVHTAINLLGNRDVLHATGARDAWHVIDMVNRGELGGARSVVRYRTQAVAGSQILRWLAEHKDLLDDETAGASAATPDGTALVEAAEGLLRVSELQAGADPEPPAAAPDAASPQPRLASQRAMRSLLDAAGLGETVDAKGREKAAPRVSIAIFEGDRHTGKTLAAFRLAHALGKELHRVDLSRVVSKFIGETEKNLDAVFQSAEKANALLLFEDADPLFSKRSQVKDAHDRYANLDLEQLLQRMEQHSTPVLLATNRKSNIDEAFKRRLRLVEFPREWTDPA